MEKLTEEQLASEAKEFEKKLEEWRPLLIKTCKEIIAYDRSLEYDDVMSELRKILLKSIRGFDPSKGNKFKTYFITALRHSQGNFKDEKVKRTNYTKDEMIHVAFIKQRNKWIPLYDKDPVLANIPLHVAKFQIQNEDGKRLTDEEVLDYYNSEPGEKDPLQILMEGELIEKLDGDEKLIADAFINKKKQSHLKSKRGMGKERYEAAYNSLKFKVMDYFKERFTEEELKKCGIAW